VPAKLFSDFFFFRKFKKNKKKSAYMSAPAYNSATEAEAELEAADSAIYISPPNPGGSAAWRFLADCWGYDRLQELAK
jgi:hypothetical protein